MGRPQGDQGGFASRPQGGECFVGGNLGNVGESPQFIYLITQLKTLKNINVLIKNVHQEQVG